LSTESSFPLTDQGMMQFRGILGVAPANGTTVGSIKFTWYVRFHGRTRAAGAGQRLPLSLFASSTENKENEEPQSEMSYADLQQ